MKLKLLYVTDIHNRSERANNAGRTDNYHQSILNKQIEVGEIIAEYKPDVLLFGGDLFDSYDVPTSVINKVSAIWRSYNVPRIIGVIGSHDYSGYQVKTLIRTALGNLLAHNLMSIVSNGQDEYPSCLWLHGQEDGHRVYVTGTPHSYDLSDHPENYSTPVDKRNPEHKDSIFIQLVHGDLFPTVVPWKHQTINNIHPFVSADIVLSGHIHSGWPEPIVLDNSQSTTGYTMYVNPGSIARTTNGVSRPIRVFMLYIDTETMEITYEYIALKNVIPNPFGEKSEKIEGSPITDFSHLMTMISTLDLKPDDYKGHIPTVVKELFGETEDNEEIMENVLMLLEKKKEKG